MDWLFLSRFLEKLKKKISYRNGAKINDLVVVTGDLGGSYLGNTNFKREKEIFLSNPGVQPDLQGNDYALQRQLKTEARSNFVKSFRRFRHYTNFYDRYIGWTNI